jgi:cobalt/nickel transport system permease protein
MHISEGVLSVPVLAGGGAAAFACLAVGLRRLRTEHTVPCAMLSAIFFLASLAHVPIGPANVHLTMNGLVGLLLGWAAFPAVFVALCLQAVLFQFGGLTTLGVNTMNMAGPAVLCAFVFRPLLQARDPAGGARQGRADAGAFLCGFCSLGLAGIGTAGCLALSGEVFWVPARLILLAHLPLMVVEGLVCLALARFLRKVKPEVFLAYR